MKIIKNIMNSEINRDFISVKAFKISRIASCVNCGLFRIELIGIHQGIEFTHCKLSFVFQVMKLRKTLSYLLYLSKVDAFPTVNLLSAF